MNNCVLEDKLTAHVNYFSLKIDVIGNPPSAR